jgi:acid stress-induced BolA-like protein IbaG/YrbA
MIYCVEETPVFRNLIYFLHCSVQHLQNGRSNQIQTSQIHALCLETSTFFEKMIYLPQWKVGRTLLSCNRPKQPLLPLGDVSSSLFLAKNVEVSKHEACICSNITMIYCVEETPVFRNMIYFLHCSVQHLQNGRSNQIQTSQIHALCLETSTFFARKRLLETWHLKRWFIYHNERRGGHCCLATGLNNHSYH